MNIVVLAMPGNESMAGRIAGAFGAEVGAVRVHRFPDGESGVRIDSDVAMRRVVIVCTLDRPDAKLVPLLLLAAAARGRDAATIGLVAPYLAYMRQDKRFHPGETISARHFAHWLSESFDWLVTADAHLHRIPSLSEVYRIPNRNVHAAPAIAAWLRSNVTRPVLIGPDEESAQWVGEVARLTSAPCIVLNKVRDGDRAVRVTVPDVERWRDCTPVLVDDIISTGRTMIETIAHLRRAALPPPVCVGVHAVFAGVTAVDFLAAGASRVVTCDTIPHPTNAIALDATLAAAVRELLPLPKCDRRNPTKGLLP